MVKHSPRKSWQRAIAQHAERRTKFAGGGAVPPSADTPAPKDDDGYLGDALKSAFGTTAIASGLKDAATNISKGIQKLSSDVQGKAKGGRVKGNKKPNW